MKTSWKLSRRAMLGLATLALGIAASPFVLADGGGSSTRLKTRLSGAAIDGKTPSGSAEFRMDTPSRTRLEVEVENVNLAAGTLLDVIITHNAAIAEVADRVVILAEGEVVADGPTTHVVMSSPMFAPQVAKILSPEAWLTVDQVAAAIAPSADSVDGSDDSGPDRSLGEAAG